MRDYVRPSNLPDAVAIMAASPWRVLAGGTDLYPGANAQLDGAVLDTSGIADLRGISFENGLRVGACTTWAEIAAADLPPALRALQQAALQVGGRQIQNAGTIGGNLCNASPAADGVPPLLAVDAILELASVRGTRFVPLAAFLAGPRRTLRDIDEMLVAVHVPKAGLLGVSCFLKLGARAHLVISIAMVAARIEHDAGVVTQAALAIGSCSGVAQRLPQVEAVLIGAPLPQASSRIIGADVASALSPIDDIRATAAYRTDAATELLCRAVAKVCG